jgi:hypothetical protein
MFLTIRSTPPVRIMETASPADASSLSFDELRQCFPTRISIRQDGEERILLEDVPVVGVLLDLIELWLQVNDGAQCAEAVDFYGEYRLVLRRAGDALELENEHARQRAHGSAGAFGSALHTFAEDVLGALEQHHPDVAANPAFHRLRDLVRRSLAHRHVREP